MRGSVKRGPAGKFQHQAIKRTKFTTTLSQDALEVMQSLADEQGIGRNEVIERLLQQAITTEAPAAPPAAKKGQAKDQRQLAARWAPAAEHLSAAHDLIRLEKERICREYSGPQGSLIMQGRWQRLATEWAESGALEPFVAITGEPAANTLKGLLEELERASRMTNAWIGAIAMYTGCKPDPTRYVPPAGE
jgi:hypothetical protein